jgi:hypothetical protein
MTFGTLKKTTIRFNPIIPLLFFFGLLLFPQKPVEAESRAIRPVSLKMPDGNQVKLYQGSYALVIGASNYQDNAWGDLSSVREDVRAVRQARYEREKEKRCLCWLQMGYRSRLFTSAPTGVMFAGPIEGV